MGAGDNAEFFAGDMCQQADVEGLIDFTIDHFGQLDICCLNSGGVLQTAPVAQMSDEEWKLEVDWNLNHVFWGMRRALQHMIPRDSGRIIVTSSVEGKLGKPGIPGYAATKHAVNGLAKSAAQEVGTLGITVNCVLPGLIETDIVRDTGPASASMMGLAELRRDARPVRPGVGDQAAEHRRGGRRRGGPARLRRRPEHHRLHVPGRRRHDALLRALLCYELSASISGGDPAMEVLVADLVAPEPEHLARVGEHVDPAGDVHHGEEVLLVGDVARRAGAWPRRRRSPRRRPAARGSTGTG